MPSRPRIKTRHPGIYYRERPGGERQYVIWYTGTDGKPRFENVPGGEQDAVKARARILDRIAHGHSVAPTKLTIAEWAPQWLEERDNLKPRTRETYAYQIAQHIVPRLGTTRVCDLSVNHVARLISDMRAEGLSAWTINGTLGPLSGMMRTAVRRGMAPSNPVQLLDRHERPKTAGAEMNILDTNEIKLFLNSATKTYRPLLATAIFTGLRMSELLNLRWEDVDWDAGVIHVRDSKTAAGVREVVLMPALQQILAAHSLENEGSTYVFETRDGQPMKRRTVHRRALEDTLRRAGITKRIRFHDLRHTHASILIDQGHPETFICEQMGHANAAITRRIYGHLFDRDKRREDARAKLEASFGEVLS